MLHVLVYSNHHIESCLLGGAQKSPIRQPLETGVAATLAVVTGEGEAHSFVDALVEENAHFNEWRASFAWLLRELAWPSRGSR